MEKKSHKILYVDDEEINLLLFQESFRSDFEIVLANSAKEGLEILEQNMVDVIITDQRMPEMTGVEFLREVSLLYPKIPPNRLIISGYSHNENIEKAFKHYKLFQFILKPWITDELKQIIFNAIHNKKSN